MRLCCDCFEELLNREMICPICNSDSTLDNNQTKNLYYLVNEIYKANKLKIRVMKKDSKYNLAFKYIEYRSTHPKKNNNNYPNILELSYKNNNYESQEEYWDRINQHTINKAELEQPTVTCPYCHSTDTRKIGDGERAVSVLGLGLFSNKINKSFKCKNCGGTF